MSAIEAIQQYFHVTEPCALYLYYRSFRSKRIDDKYLPWDIKIQNAIVKADRCLGLDWKTVMFGLEDNIFSSHGIIIDEMDTRTFRWDIYDNDIINPITDTIIDTITKPIIDTVTELKQNGILDNDIDGWVTVGQGKKAKKKEKSRSNKLLSLVQRSGLVL